MVTFLAPLGSSSERNHKGSIGHSFLVCSHTERLNQAGFCPLALREISLLTEPALVHLRYSFADVPPQSNSPPAFVGYLDPSLKVMFDSINKNSFKFLIPYNTRSKKTFEVGVFQVRFLSSLRYTSKVFSQKQTRVKLNRVFFPRFLFQARSLGCGFARWWVETVRISLIHSCASRIR